MKKTKFYAFCILFFLILPKLFAQECRDRKKFEEAMLSADSSIRVGNYALAQDFYNVAKFCCKDQSEKVEKAKDNLFVLINGLQQETEKAKNEVKFALIQTEKAKNKADSIAENNHRQALNAYANDLAYKSQIALQRGDRTTAYRLAEFAHRYVDDDNQQVTRALTNICYHNEDASHSLLPWAKSLIGDEDMICCISFSPSGKYLAAGYENGLINIFETITFKKVHCFNMHRDKILKLFFSHDEKKLASISNVGTTMVLNIEDGHILHGINSLKSEYSKSAAFSEDDNEITEILWDGYERQFQICVTNLQKENSVRKISIPVNNFKEYIKHIEISKNCKYLAAAYFNNSGYSVIIWDMSRAITTGIITEKDELSYISRDQKGRINQMLFSDKGEYLAISTGEEVEIWDFNKNQINNNKKDIMNNNLKFILKEQLHYVLDVSFIQGKEILATSSDDKSIKIWNLTLGSIESTLIGHTQSVSCIAYSKQLNVLASGSFDKTIRLWMLKPNSIVTDLGVSKTTRSEFSKDGKNIVCGGEYGDIKVISAIDKKNKRIIDAHKGHISDIKFSPNNSYFATGSSDNTTKIWDVSTGKNMFKIESMGFVRSVDFSNDGQYLAIASDEDVIIWDLKSNSLAFKYNENEKKSKHLYSFVTFSSNGKYIAIGNYNIVNIIELIIDSSQINYRHIKTLTGHHSYIRCGKFYENDNFFITCSSDSTIKSWDVRSGNVRFSIPNSTEMGRISLSHDQKLLAGIFDNSFKIWKLNNSGLTLLNSVDNSTTNRFCKLSDISFSPNDMEVVISKGSHPLCWGDTQIWPISSSSLLKTVAKNKFSPLSPFQMTEYEIENILEFNQNNENLLILTEDIWQIAAFADLYANKISKSLPKKEDYERAKRLYQACLSSGADNAYFEKKMADLERVWKEKTE